MKLRPLQQQPSRLLTLAKQEQHQFIPTFQQGQFGRRRNESADKYWALVRLLLQFDNTLADQSPYANTFTANGNAAVSTTTPIVGTGSLVLDGTGDYISASDSAAWTYGTSDFCWEFSIRPNGSVQAYDTFYQQQTNSNNLIKYDAGASGTKPRIVVVSGGSTLLEAAITGTFTFNSGTDYRCCWQRSSGGGSTVVQFYVDGVAQGVSLVSGSFSASLPDLAAGVAIGYDALNANRDFNGRLDAIRHTAAARYANGGYNPTSLPFPAF